MKFIIGLGNPGQEYQKTRHNVGFMGLECLAQVLLDNQGEISNPELVKKSARLTNLAQIHEAVKANFLLKKKLAAKVFKFKTDLILVQPQTYMNNSGQAVQAVLNYYSQGPADWNKLFVMHDDLDLQLGTYKIHRAKGPKVHHGLLSIYQHLNTNNFWHVRIGIDNRQGQRTIPGDQYVLSTFSNEEQQQLMTVFFQLIPDILKVE